MFYLHMPSAVSAERCAEILAQAQARGFEAAKVNYYGTQRSMAHVRNNSRLEWDNAELAQELGAAVRRGAGERFPVVFEGMPYEGPAEHMRVYRYEPGQYFKPHRDGKFRAGALITRMTVLLYLNDTEGGQTLLMPAGPGEPQAFVEVQPRAGDVLMFQHELFHEGRPVTAGLKYVLRTDLFYRIQAAGLIPAKGDE